MMGIREEVNQYSARIGNDPLLIQGAGGNISWKDDATLWIKSSGTWLAHALDTEIFVALDLFMARQLIHSGATDLSPASHNQNGLRPSIETSLHALLPQRIVVHYHAVDVIALAVRTDASVAFKKRLLGLNWLWIDYVKPGPDLACAVTSALKEHDVPDILVLGNHGLVIAADSVVQADQLLAEVIGRCHGEQRVLTTANDIDVERLGYEYSTSQYVLPANFLLHSLACDSTSLAIAQKGWVLYPDHAVFLGPQATVIANMTDYAIAVCQGSPECILVPGRGMLTRADLNAGQIAMLDCYLDVLQRLDHANDINPLTAKQVAELLNWDAEKYRQTLQTRDVSLVR